MQPQLKGFSWERVSDELRAAYDSRKQMLLVLHARTPDGIDQEVYPLLVTYQTLRLAITDATAGNPTASHERGSFTVALHAARDQIVHAAGIVAGTTTTTDLVGKIGRAVLTDPLPPRRIRVNPRVVKPAISKHRAKGKIDRTNYQAAININILGASASTPDHHP